MADASTATLRGSLGAATPAENTAPRAKRSEQERFGEQLPDNPQPHRSQGEADTDLAFASHAPGQHQQVAPLGVGNAVLRSGQAQGELGAEDGGKVVGRRGLGQHRRAVEAVVVGDRERVEAESYGLLDELTR